MTTNSILEAHVEAARADAWRDYGNASDAVVALNAIDRVAAHVAEVLEADR